MGKGGEVIERERSFDWNEIKQHDKPNDKWLVVDGEVYDITRWLYKHPGGRRVIGHYAGQDATVRKPGQVLQLVHGIRPDLNRIFIPECKTLGSKFPRLMFFGSN